MRRFAMPDRSRPSSRIMLLAIALTALLAPGIASAKQATKPVAEQAANATLGRTVLTTLAGRTLYSLSAETNGRFICTGSCLSTWRPLVVSAAVKPTGPVKLGTIKRPDKRTQVTYKGRPLYTFAGDTKPGEVDGEGIRDVGTWRCRRDPRGRTEARTAAAAPARKSLPVLTLLAQVDDLDQVAEAAEIGRVEGVERKRMCQSGCRDHEVDDARAPWLTTSRDHCRVNVAMGTSARASKGSDSNVASTV